MKFAYLIWRDFLSYSSYRGSQHCFFFFFFKFNNRLKQSDSNSVHDAKVYLLKLTQQLYYKNEIEFLQTPTRTEYPELVIDLNLFCDQKELVIDLNLFCGKKGFIQSQARIDKIKQLSLRS